MRQAYDDGMNNIDADGCVIDDPDEDFIDTLKCIQQPTEIEVRIAMGCSLPNGCTEPDVECTCEPIYNLDENGCLRLWVLNTEKS